MSKPYSVTLHITEKNCSKDKLDKLIALIQEKKNFSFLGSSFSPDKSHNGSTLVKSVSGENAETVLRVLRTILSLQK